MTKEKIRTILAENREILRKYAVKSIAIFGSYARDEQREDSDIDFLVEFENPTFDNYMGLISGLEALFKQKVDLVSIKALKPRIKPYILKEAEWVR